MIYRVFYIPGGAGFQPSTVGQGYIQGILPGAYMRSDLQLRTWENNAFVEKRNKSLRKKNATQGWLHHHHHHQKFYQKLMGGSVALQQKHRQIIKSFQAMYLSTFRGQPEFLVGNSVTGKLLSWKTYDICSASAWRFCLLFQLPSSSPFSMEEV